MKVIVIALVVCVAVVVAVPADKYTTKFDNVNLDDILASDRLLQNYVNCLNGSGKCSPDGSELKRVLPEALETDCSKCSEKQREGSKKVITFLVNEKPKLWQALESTYDPEGKYKVKFQKEYDAIKH